VFSSGLGLNYLKSYLLSHTLLDAKLYIFLNYLLLLLYIIITAKLVIFEAIYYYYCIQIPWRNRWLPRCTFYCKWILYGIQYYTCAYKRYINMFVYERPICGTFFSQNGQIYQKLCPFRAFSVITALTGIGFRSHLGLCIMDTGCKVLNTKYYSSFTHTWPIGLPSSICTS